MHFLLERMGVTGEGFGHERVRTRLDKLLLHVVGRQATNDGSNPFASQGSDRFRPQHLFFNGCHLRTWKEW